VNRNVSFLVPQNLTCSIRICNYVNSPSNKEIRIAANQGLRMVGGTANRCLPREENHTLAIGGYWKKRTGQSILSRARRVPLGAARKTLDRIAPVRNLRVPPAALGNGLRKDSPIPDLYPFYELTLLTPINDAQILLLRRSNFLSYKIHAPLGVIVIYCRFRLAVWIWVSFIIR